MIVSSPKPNRIPIEPASVCVFTLSNMNISATSWLITNKFYLNGGKAALGLGPDRIRTLVSMATDSSHRVLLEKILWLL